MDSPEESSAYPQVGKSSHLPEFQAVYWRCVAVFFTLSKRFNPEAKHLLFSNKSADQLPVIDGLQIGKYLQDLNVELITLPLTFQTPKGYFGRWRNQFYIFDILKFFEKNEYKADDRLLVLDSDCLIRHSLDEMMNQIGRHQLMVLPMLYGADDNINGISRLDMQELYGALSGQTPPEIPVYFGGEFFAATVEIAQKISQIAQPVWTEMLRRFEAGLPKFNEEAHLLSYCYDTIGVNYALATPYIKRIWTAPHYNNVQPQDASLPIWHLPSEKTGGIALLFKNMEAVKGVWSLDNQQLATGLGQYVGVPRRTRWLNLKHRIRYSFLRKLFKN
jgi:alpha-N-acetylglucosamine transferase